LSDRTPSTTLSLPTGFSVAQTVTQSQPEMSVQEGESVTLRCTYRTSYTYYDLCWYKQLPSGQMVFVICQASDQQNARQNRFSVNFHKAAKSISLTISHSQLEDSTVYFCALREATGREATGRQAIGTALQKP
uniref:Ig-like domain-containing protein n=1 Tax=Otolemur garnettii TaxID=30611 RepID=H0Y244_OTOGA